MPARFLLVDSNPKSRELALRRVRRAVPAAETVEAADAAEFALALSLPEFDVILAGARLGRSPGAEVLATALARWPDTSTVLYARIEPAHLVSTVRAALALSLRRHERRTTDSLHRIMFEQSLSGIYVGVLDGGLVDCNPAFVRMFGYDSLDQVRGRLPTEFVPRPEQVEHALERMMAHGGILTNAEAMGRRRDGSTFHALFSARLHESAGTKLVIGTVVDVSESHWAREALRQSALEWRTTFDGISSPILVVRPDGEIVRINAAGRALAGHEYPDVIGHAVGRVAEGEPWRAAAEMIRTIGNHAGPQSATVHDPERGSTWDLSAFQTGLGGSPDHLITLVLRDITEVVGLQESLVRSQTMSTLGQLIAGVAHEVRSPLFGISATLDAFDARFGEEPAFRVYLDNLRRELERMNDLMRDLLELGRPAATPRSPVAIGLVIAEAVDACTQVARERRIVLRELLTPATAARAVLADRRRLLQVFENLLKNAIQHAPKDSEVDIVEAPGPSSAMEVTIGVVDHGPGFRSEDLGHLFEPFFTRRTGGTGLGLAIVRRIVEDHGGTVQARNARAGGATVLVTLPAHDAGAEART